MTSEAGVIDGDQMVCRSCGLEQRASEGYPCAGCGTFICVVCEMRGVTHCRACAAGAPAPAAGAPATDVAPAPPPLVPPEPLPEPEPLPVPESLPPPELS